jgi:D-alanyl-D-alanine carboxypeptidase
MLKNFANQPILLFIINHSVSMPSAIKKPFLTPCFGLVFSLVIGLIFAPTPAHATLHHIKHHKVHHIPATVDSSAGYADIVIDAETGQVLHATNPDSLRHPASLTKMMTLYLTFQALESGRLSLNQTLPISTNASEQSPSKLGLRPGQRIRVEDAILGLVTESANDAAVVLAEALGGSEEGFGAMMTRQAHALGMAHSQFDNPSGLPDPDQVTTAHDMALLGHALIYHYPQFYPYFSHDSFTYAGIYHHNHNHLMDRYDGMDGIKTGYIRASGFNLVASATRNGTRLIGVVFGGKSAVLRDNHMAQLLDDCFAETRGVHTASLRNGIRGSSDVAQGDGDDSDSDDGPSYIKLPSKVSAVFPAHDGSSMTPTKISGIAGGNIIPPLPPVSPLANGNSNINANSNASAANNGVNWGATNPNSSDASLPAPIIIAANIAPSIPAPIPPAPPAAPTIASLSMPPAGAPPSAPAAPVQKWGIQIGAYGDPAMGRAALTSLVASMPKTLGAARPVVEKVSAGNMVMYRARLMDMDQKTAQSTCNYLLQHGQSCLAVSEK